MQTSYCETGFEKINGLSKQFQKRKNCKKSKNLEKLRNS